MAKGPVDPALIVQLIAVVIQILMQLLAKNPRAVADHLSGADVPFLWRWIVVWKRWANVRAIVRERASGKTDDVPGAVEAVCRQLDGVSAATVAQIYLQSPGES